MTTIYSNQEEVGIAETIKQSAPKDSSSHLSVFMDKFLGNLETKLRESSPQGGATIKVSEVLGGLARIYERIRTTVEYKGEHVIRRNAIERILKRLIWEQGSVRDVVNEKKVAESLTRELIWARYLPNNFVPKVRVEELRLIIEKYTYFLKNLDSIPAGISPSTIRTWIWGVASSEIEDLLDPSYRELYVELMHEWFTSRFNWVDTELSSHDKDLQIYLSIHRAFTKSDEPIMRYNLLLKEVPSWKDAKSETINNFIINFPKIYTEIESHLNYKNRFSLYRRVQKHTASFEIFREIGKTEGLNLRKIVSNPNLFDEKVLETCSLKYSEIGKKINTGIARSIIYIFITKVVLAMIVEIPYEVLRYGDIKYVPLAINIFFPPSMMWLIGMSIRVPGAKNTKIITEKLTTVCYAQNTMTQQFSVISSKRNNRLSGIFGILYLAIFLLVFGGITYILTILDFTLLGMIIFFMFLSLVTLFAYRVRFNATQLKAESDQENIVSHITNYLMLPFLNTGFYLSKGLAKINFFSVFLDFIIEAPLKSIIEIFEEWTSFMREKREEVVEIPE